MPSLPIQTVADAIKKAGLNWQARESRISLLARDVRPGSLFGLSIGEPERVALMRRALDAQSKVLAVAPPPKKIDWRDNRGNWVTGVRNQRTCGSCVAHATCASIESRILISQGKPDRELDLSESHLFACGGGSCSNGWNFEPALKQARDIGIGEEADFPYQPNDVPCRNIPVTAKVVSWNSPTSNNLRKVAIATSGPVIAGMRVFSDFYSYGGGIYRHTIGELEGLHAVAVVGYDDNEQYWIVKNSWDRDWGEAGYVRMGYGQCGIDSEFPFFDPAVVLAAGAPVA